MTTPSDAAIEAVARAIYNNARMTYATRAVTWDKADDISRRAMLLDAKAGLVAYEKWKAEQK